MEELKNQMNQMEIKNIGEPERAMETPPQTEQNDTDKIPVALTPRELKKRIGKFNRRSNKFIELINIIINI